MGAEGRGRKQRRCKYCNQTCHRKNCIVLNEFTYFTYPLWQTDPHSSLMRNRNSSLILTLELSIKGTLLNDADSLNFSVTDIKKFSYYWIWNCLFSLNSHVVLDFAFFVELDNFFHAHVRDSAYLTIQINFYVSFDWRSRSNLWYLAYFVYKIQRDLQFFAGFWLILKPQFQSIENKIKM